MIVCVAGSAASGKTSAANELAQLLGLPFFDTGTHLRYLATLLDDGDTPRAAARVALRLPQIAWVGSVAYCNGRQLAGEWIESEEVGRRASELGGQLQIREIMFPRWKALEQKYRRGLVISGRGVAEHLFPHCDHAFELACPLAERAERRGCAASALEERDGQDVALGNIPARRHPDTIRIETAGLTARRVAGIMRGHIEGRG